MAIVAFGGNIINFRAYEAYDSSGNRVQVSKKGFMLLKLLIDNKNEFITRDKIFQLVWGHQIPPISRTIDNYIWRFRKFFEEDPAKPKYFHSARSLGYMFKD